MINDLSRWITLIYKYIFNRKHSTTINEFRFSHGNLTSKERLTSVVELKIEEYLI